MEGPPVKINTISAPGTVQRMDFPRGRAGTRHNFYLKFFLLYPIYSVAPFFCGGRPRGNPGPEFPAAMAYYARGIVMITSSVPREAVHIYNRALELSNQGNHEGAIEEYRRAIEAFPAFVAAHNNIGEIHARRGESDKAIAAYLEALKIEPHHRVLLNLGVEHYNRERYDKALDYCKKSLAREPQFIEGNYYAGLVCYNTNEYKKAEKYLREVIKNDGRHLKANYLLAHIYYEGKQYGKAVECLDRIRNLAEDRSFFNRFSGFCCFYLGRYDDAVAYLTEALECRPEYARFKQYLEKITYESKMKEIGDLGKAIRELEDELGNREPHVLDLTKLSMLYIFKGEYKKAEKLLETHMKKLA